LTNKKFLFTKEKKIMDEVQKYPSGKKKWLWLLLIVVAVVIVIVTIIPSAKGEKGKYIGTKDGETMFGAASTWETVLELKSGGKYTLNVTRLQTGKVTLSSSGTYRLEGEGKSTIIFTDTEGRNYQAEYAANANFITFGYNSGFSSSSGLALSVRKK